MHLRQFLEVVHRGWRRRCPLQCPGVPGIVASELSPPVGDDEVVCEDQDCYALNQSSYRDDQIKKVPSSIGLIGIDRSGHPQKSEKMHRVEGDVKANRKQPEMPLSERLAHQPSGRFWIPVVDGSEDAEHNSTNKHVMEVGDHEVRIMELPIPGRYREHDASEAGNQELKQESNAEQHRSCEPYSATPKSGNPVENLDPGWYADEHR